MAKAIGSITLMKQSAIQRITRYYKLASALASTPSLPAYNSITSAGWSSTEPEFNMDTTQVLYYFDLVEYTDGEGSDKYQMSEISKASSYYAALQAFAEAKENADRIKNLTAGSRNYLLDTAAPTIEQVAPTDVNVLVKNADREIRVPTKVIINYSESQNRYEGMAYLSTINDITGESEFAEVASYGEMQGDVITEWCDLSDSSSERCPINCTYGWRTVFTANMKTWWDLETELNAYAAEHPSDPNLPKSVEYIAPTRTIRFYPHWKYKDRLKLQGNTTYTFSFYYKADKIDAVDDRFLDTTSIGSIYLDNS
jgi:hypothetical protein